MGDGNCFFNAASQAISGTQKYHKKIRLAAVKQLQSNPVAYESITRSEYPSISEYIKMSRMCFAGTWATELEIQATADFLGVSVFTHYNDCWLEYKCQNSKMSNEGVYLHNVNANHYETVVCVRQPEAQSCYGYCKVNTPVSGGYNLRCCSKCESTVSEVHKLNPVKRDKSKYLKKKHNLKCKIDYQQNMSRRENLKTFSKQKYQQNALHRDHKNLLSVRKYKDNVAHKIRVKALSIKNYKDNVAHKMRVKALSVNKYKDNIAHQERVKAFSVRKYKVNNRTRKGLKF